MYFSYYQIKPILCIIQYNDSVVQQSLIYKFILKPQIQANSYPGNQHFASSSNSLTNYFLSFESSPNS